MDLSRNAKPFDKTHLEIFVTQHGQSYHIVYPHRMASVIDPRLRASVLYTASRPRRPSPLRYVVSVDDFEAVEEKTHVTDSAMPSPEKPEMEPFSDDDELSTQDGDGEWEDVEEGETALEEDRTGDQMIVERVDVVSLTLPRPKITLRLPGKGKRGLTAIGVDISVDDENNKHHDCQNYERDGQDEGAVMPLECNSALVADSTLPEATHTTKRKRQQAGLDDDDTDEKSHSSRQRTDNGPSPAIPPSITPILTSSSTTTSGYGTEEMPAALPFRNADGSKPAPDSVECDYEEDSHTNSMNRCSESRSDGPREPFADSTATQSDNTQLDEFQSPSVNIVIPRVWQRMVSCFKKRRELRLLNGGEDIVSSGTTLGSPRERMSTPDDTTPSSFTIGPSEGETDLTKSDKEELLEAARIVDWQPRIFAAAASRFNTALLKQRGDAPKVTSFCPMDGGRFVATWDDGKERTAHELLVELGLA